MSYIDQDGSEPADNADIRISRQVYTRSAFGDKFEYNAEQSFSMGRSVRRFATSFLSSRSLKNACLRFFPFISIMGNYNWKRNLIRDVIAGATVSAMHIPQGMAYGQLASLRPVHGLYVSFFPVLIYFFFGTSRQISIGSFAVISLMVAKVLDGEISSGFFPSLPPTTVAPGNTTNFSLSSISNSSSRLFEDLEMAKRVELAVTLNLITGIMQILLGLVGAGFITQYLSDPFISGYTTGCACHVFTSQLKYVFGVTIPRHTGSFKIYETWRDVILNLLHTNLVTLAMSAVAAGFLLVCKFLIDPQLKRVSPMPIPAELILIIVADIISYFAAFGPDFSVQVVGPIPSNFPLPHVPTYFRPQLIIDCIPLVLVSFSLCISMGKLFSKQYKYKIHPNQEFFAIGIANAASSFFDCYTASASMSRSLVQANVGGQTQLAAVVSCCVILSVILFLGSLLHSLPTCILAVVVMVNLRGMFMQTTDLKKYWQHCKIDAVTWCVAFLVTVCVDVDIGLYVGVSFVLLTVIYNSAKVQAIILRQAGSSELFAGAKSYANLSSTYPAVVVRWSSPIYFATVEKLVSVTSEAANVPVKANDGSQPSAEDGGNNTSRPGEMEPVKTGAFGADEEPLDSLIATTTVADNKDTTTNSLSSPIGTLTPRRSHNFHSKNDESSAASPVHCSKNITAVILDLSGVAFMDTIGLDAVKQLAQDLSSNGVDLLLASCPDCVLEILQSDESLRQSFNQLNVFMSSIDALVAVRRYDMFAQFKPKEEIIKTTPSLNRPASCQRPNLMDSQASLIQAQLAKTSTNSNDAQNQDVPKDEEAVVI